ncbi:MAG TPA: PIN domain-containing protein, partial [Candidatus Wallbacteria bacterium]|nr:PIN domain-containing protein [Candidatus Wallbacteria bacterium]
ENVLRISKWFCEADEKVLKIAERLECEGIKAYDALHLACAEALDAEFFITCDDKLIKRYRGSMRVADPVNFVHETIYGG